jgi:hypothetical protein
MDDSEDSLVALRVEEWGRVLALSFRSEEFCEIVVEQVELEVAASSRLPCEPHHLLDYIAQELHLNLHYVDWFFAHD